MPFKSKSQERLMQGVAHNPEFAKKVGIPQSVGKKFVQHKAEGGSMATKMPKEGSAEYKAQERKHVEAMKKAGVPKRIVEEEKREAGLRKGGKVGGCGSMKKYAKGGGIEAKGKTRGKVC